MIHVTAEVDIARAGAEVFDYLAEVENNTEWLSGMRSCRWTSQQPIRVGSTYAQVSQFLGREIRTSFEVTAYEPGHMVTIESRHGSSFPITVTRRVDATGAGRCHVTETVDGDASGFYSIAAPVLRRVVQRTIRRDYVNLKRLLES
jgi:carbon monoxide dehydrogenase subunit G